MYSPRQIVLSVACVTESLRRMMLSTTSARSKGGPVTAMPAEGPKVTLAGPTLITWLPAIRTELQAISPIPSS